MGTTFTARYASTDFNLTGVGTPDPGYTHVRGLVLLEGGGGSTAGAPLTADTNFTDWYYPNAGLSVTSVTGVCSSGTCTVGDVGALCSTNAQCSQSISLDSSALSIGRGRRDIENLTQAAAINVPVFAVSGTNGLATVPGVYIPFASSIGPCTAASCDGTPRVVNPTMPNTAFPTFDGINGGFEVVVAEGLTHIDVLSAEDVAANPIVPALTAFLARNAQ